VVFSQALALDVVRARIKSARERDPGSIGKVSRRRGVQGGRPVIAGTRIPADAIQRYLQAGYGTQEIIEEHPSLSEADIEAARQHAGT
jgi:uncharacterized protein (DUF433 family)